MCSDCFHFLKNKKNQQQNYVTLNSEHLNNSEIKSNPSLHGQALIEAVPIPLSENLSANKNLEETKNEVENLVKNESVQKEVLKIYEKDSLEIINNLYQKMNTSYEGWDKLCDDHQKPHKLKMHLKSYLKEDKNRINILRLEYIAPCSAKEFILFQNDVEESKRMIAKNVEIVEAFDRFGPEECFKLMYSKYKKILTASPRDFLYVKHFRFLERDQKIFWIEYSQSIEHEKYPLFQDNIRGNIILSGQMAEDVKEDECLVRSYIEIDFHLSMPLFIAKPASVMEMRGYVERCDDRLKELKLLKENEKKKIEGSYINALPSDNL